MHVTFKDGKKRIELTATERKKIIDARLLMQALSDVGLREQVGNIPEEIDLVLSHVEPAKETAKV